MNETKSYYFGEEGFIQAYVLASSIVLQLTKLMSKYLLELSMIAEGQFDYCKDYEIFKILSYLIKQTLYTITMKLAAPSRNSAVVVPSMA